jgi:hypothetical protein
LDDELNAVKADGDSLVNTEVLLLIGNTQQLARFSDQKRDQEGNPVDSTHQNPALDTHVYEVHFPNGRTEELVANALTT